MTFEQIESRILSAATAKTLTALYRDEALMNRLREIRREGDYAFADDCVNAITAGCRAELAVPGITPHQSAVLEPGAILYASWGWEQTNINFYVVVKVKGDFATVAELEPVKGPETSFMSNETAPTATILWEKGLLRRKIKSAADSTWVNLSSYKSAWLWKGESLTESHYA